MPASIIQQAASLASVLEENTYTRARLEATPFTLAMAADFTSFQEEWTKVNALEIKLRIALVSANALVGAADDGIDVLVDAVGNAVLIETQNDRNALLYQRYFGAKRPSQLKRPVLGEELETVRGWVPSLKASSVTALSALGAKLEQAISGADAAVKALGVAEQQNRDFRTVGERKALIDQANALRKLTYGKLSEMPHAFPEQHLPATFAEQFFRHDRRGNGGGKPLDATGLSAQIAEKQAEIAALQEALAKAVAEEEAAAKAAADEEANKTALAQAEKEAAEAAAKVAALKSKLSG